MPNQFLEPERGSGIVGWAVKQLAIWLAGGLVFYSLVTHNAIFRSSAPDAIPTSAVAQPDAAPADVPSGDRLRPLGQAVPLVTNALTLRARADGHVLLSADVNGARVQFLVDTGATWVSLTPADAARAGVAGGLSYSLPMTTANGLAHAAPVVLQQVRIGQLEVDNVQATVMQAPGGISLLGQSFLKRLKSYEMNGSVLTLTWQQ